MKIGIITYWQSLDNYGQQLQCYALQTLLRSWGHNAFLIRYAPKGKKMTVWDRIKLHILNPVIFLDRFPISSERKRNLEMEKKLKILNDSRNPQRQFEQFRFKYLEMTKKVYQSYAELLAYPPQADVYITGSDQVWHDSYKDESICGWFLQFGNDNIRRISYAASIGRNLDNDEMGIFKSMLRRFDAISVREKNTYELCTKQGFYAQICVDPTMLLSMDNYKELMEPLNQNEKYAFVYVLNVKTSDDLYWTEVKKYLSGENLSVKSVIGSGYCQGRDLLDDNVSLLATIPEWLSYIFYSQCVFTTSFHGVVFSVMMHRPFIVFGLKGKYGSSNVRIEQLLSMLGISERMFDPTRSIKEQMNSPINWIEVDRRLEKIKQSSFTFLRDNLV